MNPSHHEDLPAGWTIVQDGGTRLTDAGRVLVGGTPFRVLRLSDAGTSLISRLFTGDPVPPYNGATRLARRLVDAAMAHPVPAPGTGPRPAEVSVMIPVRDQPDNLRRTLATLGEVGEVVVIDDGSVDCRAIRDAAGDATVIRHDTSRGPAAARNTGLRAASGSVVAFVDADVEADPGWLEPLLAHLSDADAGGVAPRVRSSSGAAPRWLAAYEEVRSPLDLGPAPGPVRQGGRVSYVPTAALLVRRAALDAVAGFGTAAAR